MITATRRRLYSVALTMLVALPLAHGGSLNGVWETVNERTGDVESLVRIFDAHGHIEGKVERIFSPPSPTPNPLCGACVGENKNKPIVGMTILQAHPSTMADAAEGVIFDPDEGKNYRCTLRVFDSGHKLEVRGFIGIALFGRTQIWLRHESTP